MQLQITTRSPRLVERTLVSMANDLKELHLRKAKLSNSQEVQKPTIQVVTINALGTKNPNALQDLELMLLDNACEIDSMSNLKIILLLSANLEEFTTEHSNNSSRLMTSEKGALPLSCQEVKRVQSSQGVILEDTQPTRRVRNTEVKI